MSILQSLEKLDKALFVVINHDAHLPFMDPLMKLFRNPDTWIPLYVFMAFWTFIRLKKLSWLFVLFTLVTIGLTDSVTAFLLKPFFERIRPCAEPSLAGIVRVLAGCGGKYSFPSNHAANHFGLAFFWSGAIWKMTGKKWWWLYIWASLVCYAQIYVGKHYPADILAGAFFGGSVGMLSYWLFSRILRSYQKKPERKADSQNNPETEMS